MILEFMTDRDKTFIIEYLVSLHIKWVHERDVDVVRPPVEGGGVYAGGGGQT